MTTNSCIYIYNEAGWLCPIPPIKLKALLNAMLKITNADLEHIALHIVRDREIMSINNTHLSCQGPTNVLSFQEPQSNTTTPHTIILSVDTLRRECTLYGQDTIEHSIRLLAHGLGHIMGLDHGPEMFAICEKMEDAGKEFLLGEGKTLFCEQKRFLPLPQIPSPSSKKTLMP